MEPIRVRKTVYLPMPFVKIFLKRYLTSVEAWTRLCRSISDRILEVDCRPITDWLCVTLTLNTGDEKSPLAIPRPTVPLEDGELLQKRHHMLTCHLPRLEPALKRVQDFPLRPTLGRLQWG